MTLKNHVPGAVVQFLGHSLSLFSTLLGCSLAPLNSILHEITQHTPFTAFLGGKRVYLRSRALHVLRGNQGLGGEMIQLHDWCVLSVSFLNWHRAQSRIYETSTCHYRVLRFIDTCLKAIRGFLCRALWVEILGGILITVFGSDMCSEFNHIDTRCICGREKSRL